ncbi:hypothetical protein ACJJTC_018135 [Scirpophaga incertulas]
MAVDKVIWKIVLDFVVLACLAISLLALVLWAEPYQRGYFINDESIRLPFKEQTVSEVVLGVLGFAIMIATTVAVEVMRDKQGKGIGDKFICGTTVPGWLRESYATVGAFTFGAVSQQFICNLGKYVVGRLRPNFYDVCRPVPNTDSVLNEFAYIQNYTCTGSDHSLIRDARLSFPSAHSSFSLYAAVFFICYIQVKVKWRGSKLLRHTLQFAAVLGAWYVGLSRVVEHKHHWSDVAAGFLFGATSAVLTFVYVLKPKNYGLPTSWQTDRDGRTDGRAR